MSLSVTDEGDATPGNDVEPNGHLPEDSMMDVDPQEREESTGSGSSSQSQKRKRASENGGGREAPANKMPRRTKRTVAAAPVPHPRDRSRSGATTRKPNMGRRAPVRRTRATVEDGESVIIEETGETRCVCGLNDEENWDGFMLQCETCNCWQHGHCVGIAHEKDAPRSYFCEQCRPDLHPDSYDVHLPSKQEEEGSDIDEDDMSPSKLRERESADAAMVSHFLHKGGRRKEEDDKIVYPPTSHFAEPKNPGRRRSTMNSRDAAYEESLAQALALSQQETATMTRQVSKSRSVTQETDERPSQKRRVASRGKPRKQVAVAMAATATPTPPPADEPIIDAEAEMEPLEPLSDAELVPADPLPVASQDVEVDEMEVLPPMSPSPEESDMPLSRPMRRVASRNGTASQQRAMSPDDSSEERSGSQPPAPPPRRRHNQYTKARALAEKAARASPNKRNILVAKDTDGDDSSVPLAVLAAARKRKPKGSSSHASLEAAAAKAAAVVAVANAVAYDEAEMAESRHSTNPWHLPAHLEHMAAALGTPPAVPLFPRPKYPTKRATVADMRKRTGGLLRYLERSQDMLEKLTSTEEVGAAKNAATLIAELQGEVKSWQEKFADVPSAAARSALVNSIVAEA